MTFYLTLSPQPDSSLLARVSVHIGAAGVTADGHMLCPSCGVADFGPTVPLNTLAVFENGFLPRAPLVAGVCLTCGHVFEPTTLDQLAADGAAEGGDQL